jgi:hypothetical protein
MVRVRGAIGPGLLLLAGVLAVQWLPHLPSRGWSIAMLVLACALACTGRRGRWVACCLFGVGWSCLCGGAGMEARLPHALEGKDVWVEGRVSGLPSRREDATGFLLVAERAWLDDVPLSLHGLIRVNSYNNAPALAPCSHWRLRLRLKRPRACSILAAAIVNAAPWSVASWRPVTCGRMPAGPLRHREAYASTACAMRSAAALPRAWTMRTMPRCCRLFPSAIFAA